MDTHTHIHIDTHTQTRHRYTSEIDSSFSSDEHLTHDHSHIDGVFQNHSTIRSIILLIALSFHSVFEGMAIGLQENLTQLISLFMAVIAHKAVMAFSLGLTLAQAALSTKQYMVSILIFSLASPIGMAIGMALAMEHSLGADIAN